nr:MBL fold metallo-hydrolase [Paenibacillus pini]
MPEITKHKEDGLTQVKISMAYPLRWVNSYILHEEDGGGVTIIDPGPRNEETEAEWALVMDQLGFTFTDVLAIVLTHHHPDHVGLSGWFQEQSGCEVWISERAEQERQLMWGPHSTMAEDLPELFRVHGMPEEWVSQLKAHLDSFLTQVSPSPKITLLKDGIPIEIGGRSWLPIETWGHAAGHISLYHPQSGVILCGDAVLPQISPNVSLTPGSDPQPLYSFMQGLERLKQYEVSRAFAGHRNPFTHYMERLDALLEHHKERLERVQAMLQGAPATGFEICTALFGNRLGIHQLRFAMCEALAHTTELVRRGHVELFYNDKGKAAYRLL